MSSNVWFSSDFHFNHRNIIKYSNRPFNTVEEMDDKLITNINERVGRFDRLYFLGDFCFKHQRIKEFREKIRCVNIYAIYGNHDQEIREKATLQKLFVWCKDYAEIKVVDQDIILSHYAMRTWNKKNYGSWSLHGHSHGNLPDDPELLSIDVGVDCHNYYPIDFDELSGIMSKKGKRPIKKWWQLWR